MITQLYDNDVYTGEGYPPNNINPNKLGSIYVDRLTGQRWFCKNITPNRNQWVPSAEGFGSYHYYGMNTTLTNRVETTYPYHADNYFSGYPEYPHHPSWFRPAIIYQNRTGFPIIFNFTLKVNDIWQSEFYISSDDQIVKKPYLSGQWHMHKQGIDAMVCNSLTRGFRHRTTALGSSTVPPTIVKDDNTSPQNLTPNNESWSSVIIPPNYYFAMESDGIGTKGTDGSQFNPYLNEVLSTDFVSKKNKYNVPIVVYDYYISMHYDFSNFDRNNWKRTVVDMNKKALYKVHNYYDDSGTDREGNNRTYQLAGFE